MIEVSVVIPERNNFAALRSCLDALGQQTFERDRFEIIVVDNGSDADDVSIRADYPQVKWLFEPRPGSYCARNCGIRQAAGAIIAFTDADCIPAPDWLSNAVHLLKTTEVTAIGGKIDFINPVGRSLNIYEIIEDEMFDMVNHQRVVETQRFAMTANLITFRTVLDRVGLFDDTLLSSGDREWGQRAVSRNEVLKYSAAVVIRHPRRSSFNAIDRKLRRVVGGKIQLALKRRKTQGLGPVIQQWYLRSVFNLGIYRFILRCNRVDGFLMRAKLAMATLGLMSITTLEGIRVALGRKPHRG